MAQISINADTAFQNFSIACYSTKTSGWELALSNSYGVEVVLAVNWLNEMHKNAFLGIILVSHKKG